VSSTAAPIVLPPLKERLTPNRSSRHGQTVHLVVVHDTEGGYAGSIATLCDPGRQASAHVVVREDGREATQLVPWNEKAWACVAFNSVSDNIELAGFHDRLGSHELRVGARVVAFRLHKRGLPARWSRDGKSPGFCRHYDLGAAGGGHTDPTTRLLYWLRFVAWVKYEARRGHFRQTWGVD
jgi:N-acetylmuramoyl-L-alanine amidase-like protein